MTITSCTSGDSRLHHAAAVDPPGKWSSALVAMSTPLRIVERAKIWSGSPRIQRATLTV